jgi:spore maturation protein CgeB
MSVRPAGTPELLIVGNPEPFHVGAHFLAGARSMGIPAQIVDVRRASASSRLCVKWNWWFRGRRPARLSEFDAEVAASCRRFRPKLLLTTGVAPVSKAALEEIGGLGVQRVNYSTDDPWNPAHLAPWFLAALPSYDQVFSTRRSNHGDFIHLGCKSVGYLPFGYATEIHFPEKSQGSKEREQLASDVLFIGGADTDRLPYIAALISEGHRLALYGGYWDRNTLTKPFTHGNGDPAELRKATAAAKVVLCLVRRANRDGHVMRTFETAATGACMLVEDTAEHREIFGADGESVVYFRDQSTMLTCLKELLADEPLRCRLKQAAYERIVSGRNTYRDRLMAILERCGHPFGAVHP